MKHFGLFLTISFSFLSVVSKLNAENIRDKAEETLQFIQNVQSKLKLTREANIILLIGNSGSGKSTLAHYIAGDYSKLISLEPSDDKMDYTIHDGLDPDIDKVSSTTVSRTLVPEMLVDESKFVWYDCPGFGDTRNTTVEIATTFLIKSVIENALNIKIVLVVNHGSVVEGYDRFDLDKLFTHTTELIRNIDRYKNSVSMVVTKVEPYKLIGRKPVDVTEQNIKKSVEKYLRDYRKVLVEKGLSSPKIQLADALLEQSPEQELRRIGVFWRPGDGGPFNQIEKMVKGRQLIRETVFQQTIYTEIQQHDLGYSLTDAAQIRIVEMEHLTIKDIHRISSEIDKKLLILLKAIINRHHDFHERVDLLGNINRMIENVKTLSDSDNVTISDLAKQVNNMMINLNLTLHSDELRQLIRLEQNSRVFQSMARIEISVPISDYISEMFASTANYIRREQAWSTFLVGVYEFFICFEVQKDVKLYNVKNLRDWKKQNKMQGLHITNSNFQEFAKHFSSKVYTDVTDAKLKELNEIITFTLKTSPTIECDGDTMTIKGNFLKSLDIQEAQCPSRVSKIRVFVVNTFFVDSNLFLDADLDILAFKWIILNKFTFHLNGKNGKVMEKLHSPGTPGQPGNIGSNGHNIFGFANEIINGDSLTVNITGGNGGVGQDGVRNKDRVVELPSTEHEQWLWLPEDIPIFYENYLSTENQLAVKTQLDSVMTYFLLLVGGADKSNVYKVSPRICCGKNGLGGPGGAGGLPGQRILITTSATDKLLNFVASNGNPGQRGNDPEPCRDQTVTIAVRSFVHGVYPILRKKTVSFLDIVGRSNNTNCPSEFARSPVTPAKPVAINPLQPTMTINQYKQFLRHKMIDMPHLNPLQIAYDAIDSNAEVKKMLTIKDLAVETNALEKQFHELNGKLDLMPFYVSLLNQTEKFKDDASFPRSSTSEQRMVSLLYAHTLSKIISLKNGKNSDLIIDIEKYFEVVLNNINNLEQSRRAKVINDYRNSYKAALDAKISEGIDFIKNGIQTEIETLFHELDDDIRGTIDEIVSAQVKTMQEIKARNQKIRNLQQSLFVRTFANVLNIVQMFVGDFGSIGTALIDGAKNGLNANERDIAQTATVPPAKSNQSAIESIAKNSREKVDAVGMELDKINNSLKNSTSPQQKGVGVKLSSLYSLAKELIAKGPSAFLHDKIESIVRKFKELVNEQVNNLKDEYGPVIESFRNSSSALNIIESAPSLYHRFFNDDDKIHTIGVALKEDQQMLRKLREIEADICSDLMPSFGELQGYLNTTATELKQKSSIALMVQRVKIQKMMRKVQKRLSDTMNGLDLVNSAAIKECIVKIHEAINLIINIYDRIQSYEEQSNLFDHLAELQSADFSNIHIEDAHLRGILNDIQFNLQSNVLLAQYDRAVDGFKQAVFPFAADYLDIYRLPQSNAAGNDSKEIIGSVVDNVKTLSERIKELNTTVINRNDAEIYMTHFNRKSGPFFIWPKNEVQEQTRQLFSGQKIYLLADVRRSSKLNAVKFNSISIKFRVTNSSLAPELKKTLLPFHVTMVHMGDSHYRCGNGFYTINSPSQEISYSFRQQSHAPTTRNAVYDKLNSGIPLLSPYALWSVQLSHGRFEELAPYIGLVDIELHGYGKYIGENANVCSTELWRYYSIY